MEGWSWVLSSPFMFFCASTRISVYDVSQQVDCFAGMHKSSHVQCKLETGFYQKYDIIWRWKHVLQHSCVRVDEKLLATLLQTVFVFMFLCSQWCGQFVEHHRANDYLRCGVLASKQCVLLLVQAQFHAFSFVTGILLLVLCSLNIVVLCEISETTAVF